MFSSTYIEHLLWANYHTGWRRCRRGNTWCLPTRISQSQCGSRHKVLFQYNGNSTMLEYSSKMKSRGRAQQRHRKGPGVVKLVAHVNTKWLKGISSFARNFPGLHFSCGKCVERGRNEEIISKSMFGKQNWIYEKSCWYNKFLFYHLFIHLVRSCWILPSTRSIIVAFCINNVPHNLASSSKLLWCNRMWWTQGLF